MSNEELAPRLSYIRLLCETYDDLVQDKTRFVLRVKAYERMGTSWPGPKGLPGLFDELIKSVRAEIEGWVKEQPIWTEWLSRVKGVGAVATAMLLAKLHYSRFPNPSKLWKYVGLAPVNGRLPKKRRGERGFPTKLKALVCYKVGWMGFVVHKPNAYYYLFERFRDDYGKRVYVDSPLNRVGDVLAEDCGRYEAGTVLDTRKARWLVEHGYERVRIKLKPRHAMMMALVKMVKIFLTHYWLVGRYLDGLDIRTPWIIEHGGHGTIYPPMVDRPEPMVWPVWWEIQEVLEEQVGRKLDVAVPAGVLVRGP